MARPNKPPDTEPAEAASSADGLESYEAAMTAWLAALSALPECDDELARRARQTMATALSGTATPSDLFESHWSIMQTTIGALRSDDGTRLADSISDLAGARLLFAAASEAIHAVNLSAASADREKIDRILDAFREKFSTTSGGGAL